ncbi:unnamed protein product, partial [Laminaria digitata]
MGKIVEQILLHAKRHDQVVVERYREYMVILNELVTGRSQTLLIERQERWMTLAWKELSELLANDRPIVFVEDIHNADESSISFLEQCYSSAESSHGVALVVTCTPEKNLEGLIGLPGVEPIVHDGLKIEDIEHLFYDRMKLDDIDADWIEQIASLSKGMPDYLLEVCRTLVDQGTIWREDATRWGMEPVQLEMFTLPSGLRGSFRKRLNFIGASGRELLELLTLLDRPVEWSLLRELAMAGGEEASNVDRAIDTLRFRHLVRIDLEMSGRYVALIHREVKSVVEMLLSPEWRRALHRRIGQVLERRWREQGGDAEEVTRHMRDGGKLEEAAVAAWACGQVALDRGDWQIAHRSLELAARGKHSSPDRVLLGLERARGALALLMREECIEALDEAVKLAEENSLDWLIFHAATSAADVAWSLGALEHSTSYLERLRDVLPVMAQQPRFLELKGRLEFARGEMDQARATFEMCRKRYEHYGDPAGGLSTASFLATIAGVQGDAEVAGGMLQEAYDSAREHGLRPQLGEALLIHAHLMRLGEEPDRALRLLNDALEAMSGGGSYGALWIEVLIEVSCAYEMLEDYVDAEQRAIEALLLSRRLGHAAGDALATIIISDLATRRPGLEALEQ